ncbi:pantetheine-phosphate adenylyltransferase [Mycoplasmatota bacterium]|nr:pantetheine-phosphate adenylyltransferase [Mycoplasmatota bacterium]
MKVGIYPGSFDPVTFGHLDIIKRATKIFDKIIIIVANNPMKNTLFSIDERIELVKEVLKDYPMIEVETFSGLTVDCAKKFSADAIIRGLRMVTDFEFEFQMNLANKVMNVDVETVFLMTKVENSYISSSLVKEIHQLEGDISKFVPECVKKALDEKSLR